MEGNIPVANVAQSAAGVNALPLWPLGTPLDVQVFITSSPDASSLFSPKKNDQSLAHLTWDNVTWGDWKDERAWDGVLTLPSVSPLLYVFWSSRLNE